MRRGHAPASAMRLAPLRRPGSSARSVLVSVLIKKSGRRHSAAAQLQKGANDTYCVPQRAVKLQCVSIPMPAAHCHCAAPVLRGFRVCKIRPSRKLHRSVPLAEALRPGSTLPAHHLVPHGVVQVLSHLRMILAPQSAEVKRGGSAGSGGRPGSDRRPKKQRSMKELHSSGAWLFSLDFTAWAGCPFVTFKAALIYSNGKWRREAAAAVEIGTLQVLKTALISGWWRRT